MHGRGNQNINEDWLDKGILGFSAPTTAGKNSNGENSLFRLLSNEGADALS